MVTFEEAVAELGAMGARPATAGGSFSRAYRCLAFAEAAALTGLNQVTQDGLTLLGLAAKARLADEAQTLIKRGVIPTDPDIEAISLWWAQSSAPGACDLDGLSQSAGAAAAYAARVAMMNEHETSREALRRARSPQSAFLRGNELQEPNGALGRIWMGAVGLAGAFGSRYLCRPSAETVAQARVRLDEVRQVMFGRDLTRLSPPAPAVAVEAATPDPWVRPDGPAWCS